MVIISPFTFILMVALVAISVLLALKYFFPEKDNYNYQLPGVVFDRLPVFHPKPGNLVTPMNRPLEDLGPPVGKEQGDFSLELVEKMHELARERNVVFFTGSSRKGPEAFLMTNTISKERRDNVVVLHRAKTRPKRHRGDIEFILTKSFKYILEDKTPPNT